VSFSLNGKPILKKTRPPYSVELDLGRAPRIHTLTAVATSPDGAELARDEVLLNSGPHRFSVRLIEPLRGKNYDRSVRAHAEVELPEGETLDRLELYLNETLMASLYQPPFVQPILLPPRQDITYVRAVGYLVDGGASEDLVFINSAGFLEEVKINFVELYTSVLDHKGRPRSGLVAEDFLVLEDSVQQEIRRFELVDNLPIHAGILLDTSTSMEPVLQEAERAALRFFEQVLTARDRAAVITFNDRPELVVRFTNSVEVLAGGLVGLVTEGETTLYDSLIYSLYYFSGIKGKRAIVVLSDGQDSRSRYSFDEVIEFARRTGVAIYFVGLNVPASEGEIRYRINRLSEETGGRSFYIDGIADLEAVYDRISQYLIAYQSNSESDDDRFRVVELEVSQPRLEAKTMRGYYP
jgi:Ca-activated chloride channel family protein